MAADNKFMNWTSVIFDPTGVTGPFTLTGVTNVAVSKAGDPVTFKGDVASFVQAVAVPTMRRTITVTLADANEGLSTLIQGTVGSFTATLGSLMGGTTAGQGGIVLTLTLCTCVSNDFAGAHANVGSGTVVFEGYVAAGAVDPLMVATLT